MNRDDFEKRIGDAGEKEFDSLCAKARLVTNKAVIDEFAWDLQIEFPVTPKQTIIDIHVPPLRCRVQVKTTTTNSRSVGFKVSNLHLMATAHEPFFVALVVLDDDLDMKDLYLKHVWEDEIEQYLAWAAETNQQGIKLNKITKSVSFTQKERIQDCDKHKLREAMEDAIGADLSRYIARKSELLTNAGQPSKHLHFSMGEAQMDAFLDVLLQLRESAPVGEVKASAKRFGVEFEQKLPIKGTEGAVIRVKEHSPCIVSLTFYENGSDDKILLPAKFHLVPAMPEVASRLPGSLISALINFRLRPQPEDGRFSVDVISNIDYEVPYDFNDLLSAAKLLDLLMNHKSTAIMEMCGTDERAEPVIAHINSHLTGDNITPFAKALSQIQSIFEATGYKNDFKISLALSYAHATAISQLHALLFNEVYDVVFSFESSEPLDCQRESVLCQVVDFPIGRLTIVTTILFKAQLAEDIDRKNRHRYKGQTSKIEVIESKVIEDDDIPNKDERFALIDAAIAPYLKTHQAIKLEP